MVVLVQRPLQKRTSTDFYEPLQVPRRRELFPADIRIVMLLVNGILLVIYEVYSNQEHT